MWPLFSMRTSFDRAPQAHMLLYAADQRGAGWKDHRCRGTAHQYEEAQVTFSTPLANIEQKGVVLQPGHEANRLGHAEQCIKSLWLVSDRACGAVRVHRQTAQQQIREQQQSIESARTSILGFRRDFEREAQAMQVCLKRECGMPSWWWDARMS